VGVIGIERLQTPLLFRNAKIKRLLINEMLKNSQKLTISFTWVNAKNILTTDKNILVNQVYCWVLTKDYKLVLVSKDGKNWQFPGGHPHSNEHMVETCKRELYEETGIDIDGREKDLQFLGYYRVTEPDENRLHLRQILQVRYLLRLDIHSKDLRLKPQEKTNEPKEERINYVSTFTLKEAIRLISWLSKSEEYKSFISKIA